MRIPQSSAATVATGLCLATASAGRAAAFQSAWTGGRARSLSMAKSRTTSRVGGVSMITDLTSKKDQKTEEKIGVQASVKDRRMGTKTDAELLDEKSFPKLELNEEEDANIKVTANAWKWPPLWPYTPDYFGRPDESDDEKAWALPKLTACLEGEARAALVSHYSRFLVDGAEILEIGASVDSYLPDDLSYDRVVGIGMNDEEMQANRKLTERLVQDLNKKGDFPFPEASFDFVLIPNTMEFFTDPRFVMREVYRVLRPEGLCMVPFTSKGAYKEYERKQIKMWKTMNDAQHMWIMGSFFKYSADAGWDNLKGYDMSTGNNNMLSKLVGGSGDVFIVQASKAIPPDPSDIGNTIRNKLYGTKSLDTDDVDFTALRLHASYRRAKTDEDKEAVLGLVPAVVDIYDLLGELPPGVLFAPYKAILATALAPRWNGLEQQKTTLRQGLGMLPPGDEVWAPLGQATNFLHPEDRVRLLVDVMPFFEGSPEERQALLEIKDVITQVAEVIKKKMPLWSIPDTQLISSDLIVTDFLTDKKEGRDGFVEWLETIDSVQLELWLDQRKTFKQRAKEELETGGLRSAAI